ncbi:MAG: sigma-70 family RNA polymerase sigma factor [Cocleimonas sp.]|nr:sigma-70 family RNA polymerase sigma factor [Cocleimonas sp.]
MPENDPLLSLLQRINAREEAAMELLYNAMVNRIYGLAIKIVGQPELAEEVVGDVFLQVWDKVATFDPKRATPIAWLLMICRSRALDRLRREKSATKNQYSENDQATTEDITAVTPLEDLTGIESSSRIYTALNILNDKQRQMIALAFYKGLSHQEISDYTGDPLGTVKSNIRRAQDILRKTLSHEQLNKGGVYGEV